MKPFLRKLVRNSLASLPMGRLLELSHCRPLSVFYHTVFDCPPPYFAKLYAVKSAAAFEKDLDLLLNAGLKPLSLGELLAAKDPSTLPPRGFFLSFDDGYREMAETIAPILLRKGIPATFFICSSVLDNRSWLFEDQIGLIRHRLATCEDESTSREINRILNRHGHTLESLASCRMPAWSVIDELTPLLEIDWKAELSAYRPYITSGEIRSLIGDGFSIGAHSIDHPLFERLDDSERLRQFRESLDTIVSRFDLTYRVFAFPYGDFGISRECLEGLQQAGKADAIFGTRGLVADELHPFMHQRLWAEDHPGTFASYLGGELAEKWIRQRRGRDGVKRL
jgi:peptidoglycan/xylan/chitin deacetylase (PgdA/CDA1 family)